MKIKVAAGVIINSDSQVLLSLRHDNAHQGGKWEFPGGKFEQGETAEQALRRELNEELNIDIGTTEPFIELTYEYPEKTVQLVVLRVLNFSGLPQGLEGQEVRWVDGNQLAGLKFPDANYPILEKLLRILNLKT